MLKKSIVTALGMLVLTGCVNRDEIYANPPQELVDGVNQLMPLPVNLSMRLKERRWLTVFL
ncbi:hypothetical protein JCM19237_2327 [Photobacterium aphoticum]|uniref:Lipoprotein n=1 Tax=Photobacterium aphoticum TaxID=754436 RepID=A0A090QMM0_9GAMM|nr:hypothetical protein JCM19237_2327 [Photobacterium aphoticum]